jgi:hypothetical protein
MQRKNKYGQRLFVSCAAEDNTTCRDVNHYFLTRINFSLKPGALCAVTNLNDCGMWISDCGLEDALSHQSEIRIPQSFDGCREPLVPP